MEKVARMIMVLFVGIALIGVVCLVTSPIFGLVGAMSWASAGELALSGVILIAMVALVNLL